MAVTGALSQTGTQKISDHCWNKTSFTLPTSLTLKLVTTTSSAATAGTEVTTGAWTNYAGIVITSSSGWNSASSAASIASITTAIASDFGTSSGGTGAAVVGWVLVDNNGNYLAYCNFGATWQVNTNSNLKFNSGVIQIALPESTGFSDYLALKMLGHLTGKLTFTAPTSYFCQTTSASSATALGTEQSYTGYSRTAITVASLNASTTGGAVVTNADMNLALATAAAGSPTTGWATMDASSSGNLLFFGVVTSNSIPINNTPKIPSGTTLSTLT